NLSARVGRIERGAAVARIDPVEEQHLLLLATRDDLLRLRPVHECLASAGDVPGIELLHPCRAVDPASVEVEGNRGVELTLAQRYGECLPHPRLERAMCGRRCP